MILKNKWFKLLSIFLLLNLVNFFNKAVENSKIVIKDLMLYPENELKREQELKGQPINNQIFYGKIILSPEPLTQDDIDNQTWKPLAKKRDKFAAVGKYFLGIGALGLTPSLKELAKTTFNQPKVMEIFTVSDKPQDETPSYFSMSQILKWMPLFSAFAGGISFLSCCKALQVSKQYEQAYELYKNTYVLSEELRDQIFKNPNNIGKYFLDLDLEEGQLPYVAIAGLTPHQVIDNTTGYIVSTISPDIANTLACQYARNKSTPNVDINSFKPFLMSAPTTINRLANTSSSTAASDSSQNPQTNIHPPAKDIQISPLPDLYNHRKKQIPFVAVPLPDTSVNLEPLKLKHTQSAPGTNHAPIKKSWVQTIFSPFSYLCGCGYGLGKWLIGRDKLQPQKKRRTRRQGKKSKYDTSVVLSEHEMPLLKNNPSPEDGIISS